MQERLARGPHAALGIGPDSSGDEVRTAFLQLTKQYHPARFARMANDIQRLSNEVFLAIRAAHDSLAKGKTRASGGMQTVRAPSQPPNPAAPLPRVGPTPVRPARMPLSNDSSQTMKSPTPPSGVRVVQGGRPPASGAGRTPAPALIGQADLAPVLDLLQKQQWVQARTQLHQLAARDPASKKVKALMHYARGREAQLDRRVDDARVELQDALALDPDLQLAKTALTELFTRRK